MYRPIILVYYSHCETNCNQTPIERIWGIIKAYPAAYSARLLQQTYVTSSRGITTFQHPHNSRIQQLGVLIALFMF